MSKPVIVVGDQTSHGGQVIEGAAATDTHGKRIARVGDKVTCPKKGHGTTTIATGDITFIIDGKAVARHGDKTTCGAILIASQAVTTTGGPSNFRQGAVSSSEKTPNGFLNSKNKSINLYDIHFKIQDELTGLPLIDVNYKITLETGQEFIGVTDSLGMTQKVNSDSPITATVEAPYYGDNSSQLNANIKSIPCSC